MLGAPAFFVFCWYGPPRDAELRDFPCPGGGKQLQDEVGQGLDSSRWWEELQGSGLVLCFL